MSPLAHGLKAGILLYRYTLSAWIGRNCRFEPTCSQYAIDAITARGALRGGWMALRRIARCNPWGGSGWDPVPGTAGAGPGGACPGGHAHDHRPHDQPDRPREPAAEQSA